MAEVALLEAASLVVVEYFSVVSSDLIQPAGGIISPFSKRRLLEILGKGDQITDIQYREDRLSSFLSNEPVMMGSSENMVFVTKSKLTHRRVHMRKRRRSPSWALGANDDGKRGD